MRRTEQRPEYIKELVATFLTRVFEAPENTLVSVTRVDVAQNNRQAHVYVSVLPETEEGHVMKQLEHLLYDMQGMLNISLSAHPAPRIVLHTDKGIQHAAHIEDLSHDL